MVKEKKCMYFKMGTYISLALLLCVHFIGVKYSYYYIYQEYDMLSHSLGGIVIGCALVCMRWNKIYNIVLPFLVVVGWEIFEYLYVFSSIQYIYSFVIDTIIDVILGLGFAYVILFFASKK